MVDYRVDEMVRDFAQRISNQGIPFEDYMKYIGTDLNTIKAQMRPNAIANLKAGLALDAIAAAENLPVTDEDIEEEQKKLAEQYHMELDQVKEIVPMDDLKQDVLRSKAEKLVIDSGKVGEAPKKEEKADEANSAEEKPAKKTAAKKTTKKAEDGEEKPAAKKTTARKTTKKAEDGEEKPAAKKTTAKKTTKKTEETEKGEE
jgi:trigger factor